METHVTPALLARVVDYGESDRICTLLTHELGKVSALARSARRSRKRYGGALSLFVVGQATLHPPRRGDLMQLESFDVIHDHSAAIGSDLVKVAHGSYVLELARELWPAQQPEPTGFALLCETLEALAHHPPSPALLRCFELSLLTVTGLSPLLDRCVRCGIKDFEDGWFDLMRGGALCSTCGPSDRPLPLAVRRMLLHLGGLSPHEAVHLNQVGDVARQTRDLMLATIQHHVGKPLRSLQFLVQLHPGPNKPLTGPG